MKRSMSMTVVILALVLVGSAPPERNAESKTEGEEMTEARPAVPIYHVFIHTPGPQWDGERTFREQPGIEEHVRFMAGLLEKGLIVMGGPFMDDSGGMMVSRIPTIEEARRIANEDPAVQSGLLRVEVRAWYVPMSSVD